MINFTSTYITLPTDVEGIFPSASLLSALQQRHSVRTYSTQPITAAQLSALLWAANGTNRPDGKRTAPSAVNSQDIELYVCHQQGVWQYLPAAHALQQTSHTDLRPVLAHHNTWLLQVPVVILLVSNQSALAEQFGTERALQFAYMDAGYVSQNIALYCAAASLSTVPCAPPLDISRLQQLMGLSANRIPLIYHPVGV